MRFTIVHRNTVILLLLFSGTLIFNCDGQEVQQRLPEKTRILFLLDGSASMLAGWSGTNRITAAKELLSGIVDSLRQTPSVELALRAYGHLYSRASQNCKDTRLEVPFGPNNYDKIIQRLSQIKPQGTTPIAYSLEQAAGDFPANEGYRNIVIIITDGIESCDGDPCAVSMALQRKNIFLRPFVIGIGMNENFAQQFSCIGEYFDAKSIDDFRKALTRAIRTSLDKTSVTVELLDEQNRPLETNINVSFINNFTGRPAFDFVHYLDSKGKPDTVQIDPVLTYDVMVNTVPPVIKRHVNLAAGRHNVIRIVCPRGQLNIEQSGAGVYGDNPKALVRSPGKKEILFAQPVNSEHEYLVGEYDVEVLTLPRTMIRKVDVKPREVKTVHLPSPGILNIDTNAGGFGSMYVIREDGRQEWVCNLNHTGNRVTIPLQPGKYKIVFRAKNAPGSKYTSIKTLTIIEGQSQLIKLF